MGLFFKGNIFRGGINKVYLQYEYDFYQSVFFCHPPLLFFSKFMFLRLNYLGCLELRYREYSGILSNSVCSFLHEF